MFSEDGMMVLKMFVLCGESFDREGWSFQTTTVVDPLHFTSSTSQTPQTHQTTMFGHGKPENQWENYQLLHPPKTPKNMSPFPKFRTTASEAFASAGGWWEVGGDRCR